MVLSMVPGRVNCVYLLFFGLSFVEGLRDPPGGHNNAAEVCRGGSGSSYIYGLVDSTYREGMSKAECKEFVKKGR